MDKLDIIETLKRFTWNDILTCKDIELHKINKNFNSLVKVLPLQENNGMECGNPIIYHYQFRNLINCIRQSSKKKVVKKLEEEFNDPELYEKLIEETYKRNRRKNFTYRAVDIYECHRINRSPIVVFKSITAKYIYNKFNAKSVLDFSAGWGGRMLGAMALGIKYTGLDTNLKLKEGYDNMLKDLGYDKNEKYKMIYKSCLDVSYKKLKRQLDYDLILTSPPYENMEIYEGNEFYKSEESFYNDFLIPTMKRSYRYLKDGGAMCINISPAMYKKLLKYKYKSCDLQIDYKQKKGNRSEKGNQKSDYIYVWTK
jgi:16S rRNA G966 N2-methylase RsmD